MDGVYKICYDISGLGDKAVALILAQAKEKAEKIRVVVKRNGVKIYDSNKAK